MCRSVSNACSRRIPFASNPVFVLLAAFAASLRNWETACLLSTRGPGARLTPWDREDLILAQHARQLRLDPCKHPRPIAMGFLADELHSRIPGRVAPIEKPAPVRHIFERHNSRPPQRAGEMGYRCI